MRWTENIRICLGMGSQGTEGFGKIKTLTDELASVPCLEWDCYRNPSVPEDILIVLRWDGDPPAFMQSDLALALIRELKRHGLVDHTAWLNTDEKRQQGFG